MNTKLTFTHSLMENIDPLDFNKEVADVSLTCGNLKLQVHSTVLASQSPYFEAMFGGRFMVCSLPQLAKCYTDV